jgi:hypothetical protein
MPNDTDKIVKDVIEKYLQADRSKSIGGDELVGLIFKNVLASINAGGSPSIDIKVSVKVNPPVAGVHIECTPVYLDTNLGKIQIGCI